MKNELVFFTCCFLICIKVPFDPSMFFFSFSIFVQWLMSCLVLSMIYSFVFPILGFDCIKKSVYTWGYTEGLEQSEVSSVLPTSIRLWVYVYAVSVPRPINFHLVLQVLLTPLLHLGGLCVSQKKALFLISFEKCPKHLKIFHIPKSHQILLISNYLIDG